MTPSNQAPEGHCAEPMDPAWADLLWASIATYRALREAPMDSWMAEYALALDGPLEALRRRYPEMVSRAQRTATKNFGGSDAK